MRSRKRLLVASVLAAFACAIGAACSFPDVEFANSTTGSEGGTGEGGPGSDGSSDGPVSPTSDAAVIDGSVRDDATAKVPDGSCLPDDCDCDRDHFNRGGCDAGPKPGLPDCDDLDPLRKPDAGLTGEKPDPGQVPFGDWNCSGTVEKAYFVNITCSANITSCTGGPGFKNDPPCGTSADYFQCKDLGVFAGGCQAVKDPEQRVQLCK